MSIKIIASVLALTIASAPAFAQDAEAAASTTTTTTAASTTATTGFAPVAGATLAAAGPLALGLGAIILIAAAGGGGSSSGTNGTN